MRGYGERNRAELLEDRVIQLRVMARRLWAALKARTGWEAEALFGHGEELRAADKAFDAAETIWERHHVTITPCRTILDPGGRTGMADAWPTQHEMYFGLWPDGSTRNVTRKQLLMMAGMDEDEEPAAPAGQEMPW